MRWQIFLMFYKCSKLGKWNYRNTGLCTQNNYYSIRYSIKKVQGISWVIRGTKGIPWLTKIMTWINIWHFNSNNELMLINTACLICFYSYKISYKKVKMFMQEYFSQYKIIFLITKLKNKQFSQLTKLKVKFSSFIWLGKIHLMLSIWFQS
jgi:hypothetical protein